MPYPQKPISLTASTTLKREQHSHRVLTLDAAAGLTVTLPAASGTGDEYEIVVGTTVTSNNYIVKVANANDTIKGGVSLSTDIAGVNMLATGTDDTITMNGSTTGGLAGTCLRLKDVKANIWKLEGFLVTTGAEATPFSATV